MISVPIQASPPAPIDHHSGASDPKGQPNSRTFSDVLADKMGRPQHIPHSPEDHKKVKASQHPPESVAAFPGAPVIHSPQRALKKEKGPSELPPVDAPPAPRAQGSQSATSGSTKRTPASSASGLGGADQGRQVELSMASDPVAVAQGTGLSHAPVQSNAAALPKHIELGKEPPHRPIANATGDRSADFVTGREISAVKTDTPVPAAPVTGIWPGEVHQLPQAATTAAGRFADVAMGRGISLMKAGAKSNILAAGIRSGEAQPHPDSMTAPAGRLADSAAQHRTGPSEPVASAIANDRLDEPRFREPGLVEGEGLVRAAAANVHSDRPPVRVDDRVEGAAQGKDGFGRSQAETGKPFATAQNAQALRPPAPPVATTTGSAPSAQPAPTPSIRLRTSASDGAKETAAKAAQLPVADQFAIRRSAAPERQQARDDDGRDVPVPSSLPATRPMTSPLPISQGDLPSPHVPQLPLPSQALRPSQITHMKADMVHPSLGTVHVAGTETATQISVALTGSVQAAAVLQQMEPMLKRLAMEADRKDPVLRESREDEIHATRRDV